MEVKLVDKGDGGEFVLNAGDLEQDNTLATAVYLSLFNGDAFYNIYTENPTTNEFQITLNLPLTPLNLKQVENKASEALKWLIDDGVCESIDVYAYGTHDEKMNIEITLKEPNGGSEIYSIIWDGERRLFGVNN